MKRIITALLVLATFVTLTHASMLKGAAKVKLDNGLTVIIKEDHSHPVASVQVWVKVGSVNENEKTRGLSHFLEHLIFKGSEKYPGQEMTYRVETQGGIINAGTSKEFTHFHIDIQKSGWQDATRILADSMANAVFPPEEIEKERPVVIEEIRRHDDNPGSVLYDLFTEAVFPTTPYRESIIGNEEVIRNVSREEIMAYYHAYYVPSNMVVSIVGDFKKADVLKLVKETFGAQKQGPVPPQPNLIEPEHTVLSAKRERPVEHDYWMGGFVGPDIKGDDQFAADITGTILGGGRSSRLFRELREKKQLVYSVSSSFWSQRGSGAMAFSALFPPEKEEAVMKAMKEEIERLMNEGPSEDEVKRAKEMTKAQWYFTRETCHEQAALLGYWEMQGNPSIVDTYIDSIEKVTAKDVSAFLKKYYAPQGLSTSLIVPAPEQ